MSTESRRQRITSGSTFEAQIGYARAVADGDWVHDPAMRIEIEVTARKSWADLVASGQS